MQSNPVDGSRRPRRHLDCDVSDVSDRGAGRLSQNGQDNGQSSSHHSQTRDSGHGAGSTAAAATGTAKNDGTDRPGASGHRFGPELVCSECGISWDLHQREPKPCKTETLPDAFARRPVGGFEGCPTPAANGDATDED